MAMFDADANDIIKCKACTSTTFVEKEVYAYKKIKDRLGEALQRERLCSFLECSICGTRQTEINDLSKKRIITKPE